MLTEAATLRPPPPAINVLELLPATLPTAWNNGATTAAAIIEALSQKISLPLPWKTVRDAINGAVQANFLEVEGIWPCEAATAAQVTLREKPQPGGFTGTREALTPPRKTTFKIAEAELQTHEIQDLAEAASELLSLSAVGQTPLRFFIQIRLGDGHTNPQDEQIEKINAVLEKVKKGWTLQE